MAFQPPQGMYLVEWVDHSRHAGENDGDEPLGTIVFRSLGWLLPEREDGIVRLAQSWDTTSPQYSDIIALDPRTVMSVTPLGEPARPQFPTSPGGRSEESGGRKPARRRVRPPDS